MMFKKYIGMSLALVFSSGGVAQQNLPQFDTLKANKVFDKREIIHSINELQQLDFARSSIFKKLGFKDGDMCVTPPAVDSDSIDIHRSLFVHDQATLSRGDFSLRRVLQKLADDVSGSVSSVTPESIFKQFWDTQNDEANQVIVDNQHCSDDDGKVNGFPYNKCPRDEGNEATGTTSDIADRINNEYKTLAIANRIDLAHEGWRNCGEHRIVFGRENGIQKNLIIFEAVLPNPKPGCRSGCRDVIEFWINLSSDSSPANRAVKLENFFFNGLPGFRPVVHTSHYNASGISSVYGGSGSGQVRTNQFMGFPWTLKEFKTFLSCTGGSCNYDLIPISVKSNPYGILWDRDVATGITTPSLPTVDNPYSTTIVDLTSKATNFQADVIAQSTVDKLGNPDINSFSYAVDLDKNAAESQSLNPVIDHYPDQFAGSTDDTFKNDLDTVAAGVGLSGTQIVNRATALSCAGCHWPIGFGLTEPNSIGPGMSWPHALQFIHVETHLAPFVHPSFNTAHFDGNNQAFNISPALRDVFLPARHNNLTTLANNDVCDCVRKFTLFPFATRVERLRAEQIINQSNLEISKELDALKKQFTTARNIKKDSPRSLFKRQKEILSKAEIARNSKLKNAGIKFETPSLKPQPVILKGQKLSTKELRLLKARQVKSIVDSEPPRRTVTGSFRSH
ncbi:MAG: hypothetical protein ABW096_04500 [Candidatus Thiodiazotropha sp.]